MSKLLLDVKPLLISPSLAKKIGLNESIVFGALCLGLRGRKLANSLKFFSKSTIHRCINRLEEHGLIQKVTRNPEEIRSLLESKNLDGKGIGPLKCTWCKINTLALEEHHYPTPRTKGGENTVPICPNCHKEYHSLETEIKTTAEGRLEK